MNTIMYSRVNNQITTVKLNKKIVGSIIKVEGGWAYRARGSKTFGETFADVDAVKRSLEG